MADMGFNNTPKFPRKKYGSKRKVAAMRAVGNSPAFDKAASRLIGSRAVQGTIKRDQAMFKPTAEAKRKMKGAR